MQKQRGFISIILAIVITTILVGGGTYVLVQNKAEEQILKAVQETSKNVQQQAQVRLIELTERIAELEKDILEVSNEDNNIPDDWQTYNNPERYFTFDYPADWKILFDSGAGITLGVTNEENQEIAVTPSLRIKVSPDGFGPHFPTKGMELGRKSGGGFIILSETEYPNDKFRDSNVYSNIIAQEEYIEGRDYLWLNFSQKADDSNWDATVDKILGSFQFTD